jgi:transcription elongation factor SPT5
VIVNPDAHAFCGTIQLNNHCRHSSQAYGTHHDPDDVVRKHYTAEDIRKEQMDDEARDMIARQDRRRAQAGFSFGDDRSVADISRDIEVRHRMSRTAADRRIVDQRHHRPTSVSGGGISGGASGVSAARVDVMDEEPHGGPEVTSAVSQQSLVPSVSDPSLWMVSCTTGKEQELIVQIMNKCVAFARQGRPLGICGAIASQTKGKIYIESYSEPAVVEAINGVRGLLPYTMKLIPIQDMTTVMTVVPKKKPGELHR